MTNDVGLRTISLGAGIQSSALVVLAGQGRIDFPVALFANVGDDSEKPATVSYVREVLIPWGDAHGVAVHELHRVKRDGNVETLRERIERPDLRSIDFPIRVRSSDGSWSPGNRKCTDLFKHKVVLRWHREHGATKDQPATVAIGFSTDELYRLGRRRDEPLEVATYPLLDLGLSRSDCEGVIAAAGLPIPPKSSCVFCPYRTPQNFAEMKRDSPDEFATAVAVEDAANAKREWLGKDPVRISRSGVRLADMVEAWPTLFSMLDESEGPESCDEGACWT